MLPPHTPPVHQSSVETGANICPVKWTCRVRHLFQLYLLSNGLSRVSVPWISCLLKVMIDLWTHSPSGLGRIPFCSDVNIATINAEECHRTDGLFPAPPAGLLWWCNAWACVMPRRFWTFAGFHIVTAEKLAMGVTWLECWSRGLRACFSWLFPHREHAAADLMF